MNLGASACARIVGSTAGRIMYIVLESP
jgi:hypothetical protein